MCDFLKVVLTLIGGKQDIEANIVPVPPKATKSTLAALARVLR